MNRETIIDDLKDDIEQYIQSNMDNCDSDISEVRQGDHQPDEIASRPFVGILLLKDGVVDETFEVIGANQRRELSIQVYGYLNSDGLGDYSVLFQLLTDLEYFFKYNFTHKSNTKVEDITPYMNGTSVPLAVFDIYIKISYEVDL